MNIDNAGSKPSAECLENLRVLVKSCARKQSLSSAIYLANKLVTLSGAKSNDVCELALLYMRNKEYKRGYHILTRNLSQTNKKMQLHYRHLIACCLFECKEYDDALSALAIDDDTLQRQLEEYSVNDDDDDDDDDDINTEQELDLRSAVCLCRARIYEAMENRRYSISWFKLALRYDVRCTEAFQKLVHERMLSITEEREFFASLHFSHNTNWLRELYLCQIEQFDQSSDMIKKRVESLCDMGFNDNLDVLASVAEHAYNRNEFRQALTLSKKIIERDPFNSCVLPVYLCSLVELSMKSELFYSAHQLAETYPDKASSWYAVGCYYYLIQRYEFARRYFSKATSMNAMFAAAWIGYGHSFAAQDESDQAMAAYRTAQRIFKGFSHIPLLCLGMENLSAKNINPAVTFFRQSIAACCTDPLTYNEIGVLHYTNGAFELAIKNFLQAIQLLSTNASDVWEATYFNIGHAFRHLQRFDDARKYYETALSMAPTKASIHCALGFTFHLQGRLDDAVDCYHKALSINSVDMFTSDLLSRALNEIFGSSTRLQHERLRIST